MSKDDTIVQYIVGYKYKLKNTFQLSKWKLKKIHPNGWRGDVINTDSQIMLTVNLADLDYITT